MDRSHLTSRRPYTMKQRPCWCQENPVGIENVSHAKNLLLFQEICIAADHVSENDLLINCVQ